MKQNIANAKSASEKNPKDEPQQDISVEPFEDIFGKTRNCPAPLPTLEHLTPTDLFFVVIADVHIHKPGQPGHGNNWRLEEAVRQINALGPEFVVHLGDNVTVTPHVPEIYEPAARYALKLLGRLKCPVYQVAGTHDIGHQHPHPNPDFICTPETRKIYQKFFGDDYHSFEVKGYRFIAINNQLYNSGYPD